MAEEHDARRDLWSQLATSGAPAPTEDIFAHGYATAGPDRSARFAVFRVGAEWYALPIACIEEISKVFDTTLVPKTAPFVVGIGNVRGRIMPVVDVATRLGISSHVRGRESRMLIVRHADEPYALVVDEVRQVVGLQPDVDEPVPETMSAARRRYIQKLVRDEERLMAVLDLDTFLDPADFVVSRSAGRGRT